MKKMSTAEMKATNGGHVYCVCSGCGEYFLSSRGDKINALSKSQGYLSYCTHRFNKSKYPKCYHKTPYYYFVVE